MLKLSNVLYEQVDDVSSFNDILQGNVENVGSQLLMRGVVDSIDTYKLFKTYENRKPRNTVADVNIMIDRMRETDYKGVFPSRINNALFATTQNGTAESYGQPFYCFVVKPYFASYSMEDATIHYFNQISEYRDGALYQLRWLLSKKNILEDHHPEAIKDVIYLLEDMSKISSIETLKDISLQLEALDNEIPDGDVSSTTIIIDELIDIITSYFEDSLIPNATAPWVKDAIEYTITCDEYYLVNTQWFHKHFKYSSFKKRYVRK